ncbi:MAG: hypothetical protein M1812_002152 [Candelaria pacifica]|nr:MAG: hypothetical protein M1812_002152 [Candelaria pacifica]
MTTLQNLETSPIVTEGDEYNSASDEDFDPGNTAQAADDGPSSSDEERSTIKHSAKRRKLMPVDDADIDFENSGDEATIRKGKRRRRRDETATVDLDDEEGGDGGLVKTRAQRAKEEKERKPPISAKDATVDVDALWASMSGGSKMNPSSKTETTPTASGSRSAGDATDHAVPPVQSPREDTNTKGTVNGAETVALDEISDSGENMVAIKRRYEFAGETITEEKLVPSASAEGRLHTQSKQSPLSTKPKPPLRRPKKRTSMFEPNPTGIVKGVLPSDGKGTKLNTIEKSKLDWAGYVDKEGIADDLDEHSRAKEGYLGRMDFLGRVEAKRDEGLKSARKK